jgi:hypothetical protein
VYLEEETQGHRWLVVWPRGYSRLGTEVLDEKGQLLARIGDLVTLGGGQIDQGTYEFLRKQLIGDVPEACRNADYWVTRGTVNSGAGLPATSRKGVNNLS